MTAHPMKYLTVTNFAAFSSLELSFGRGINIIVGENGAGKSQLIKLLYSLGAVMNSPDQLAPDKPRRVGLNASIANKLVGVFQPEELGRLTNRRQGRTRSEVSLAFENLSGPLSFSFASTARTEVKTDSLPQRWIEETPVFLPTRELLSIYPGFVSLFNERKIEFDETWRDTAILLGRPALKGARESSIARMIKPIEDALGGIIAEESGRFYLRQKNIGKLEMHLVAEGLRKLGMLARLVTSGTLLTSGYLFWDEPETNLNPRTIRQVARTIIELGRSGVQVFIATHSLFLLREIEILLSKNENSQLAGDTTYIGLHRGVEGVTSQQGESPDDLGDITALDEEINQSDRYLSEVV